MKPANADAGMTSSFDAYREPWKHYREGSEVVKQHAQETKKEIPEALKGKTTGQILKQLFFSTLYLSTFTFGGGYVIVTLLKQKFVDELHWIDEEEMLDLVAIAQSSPGAIAVNGAIVLGYQMAGIPGVLVSVLGSIIPPVVIITIISFFYNTFKSNVCIQALLRGMTAGVSAVIMSVVYDMMSDIVKQKDVTLVIVAILAFVANYFFKVNVILIILACAVYGVIRTILRGRKAA